jgi:hypothetical protein
MTMTTTTLMRSLRAFNIEKLMTMMMIIMRHLTRAMKILRTYPKSQCTPRNISLSRVCLFESCFEPSVEKSGFCDKHLVELKNMREVLAVFESQMSNRTRGLSSHRPLSSTNLPAPPINKSGKKSREND